MARIGNARTIADIEFVIDPPPAGDERTAWLAHGADCSRERHRYEGQTYAYQFDVLQLHFGGASRGRWHIVIVSELWKFAEAKAQPRTSKSLRVIKGRAADVLSWMRRCRNEKLEMLSEHRAAKGRSI